MNRKRGSELIQGQSLVEYALILALIVASVALALLAMGVSARDVYCLAAGGLGLDAQCAHYLHDDFSNLDGWTIDRGSWQSVDGMLCGGPGEGRIFRNLEGSDYTITLDGATLSQGNGYGTYFRVSEAPDFSGYSFQYDPGYGGAFIMRKWVNGNEISPPFGRTRVGANYDWWNTPRQVQIEVKGDTFTAYVDGEQVLQASDSTYTSGGVGLRTWDGTKACFDAISVDAAR